MEPGKTARIGLLSDTHGDLPSSYKKFFEGVDQIWHAGDIGSLSVIYKLKEVCPLVKAVYGNIDGAQVRLEFPEEQVFEVNGLKVYIIHIGGYPGRYSPKARQTIVEEKPGLFISGHSHILKVIPDHKNELLHINPGAAGLQGLHQKRTMMRFNVSEGKVDDLEIFEAARWG